MKTEAHGLLHRLLLDVARLRIPHIYNGACPDRTHPDRRDGECPACVVIVHAEEEMIAAAEDVIRG